jgi:hypothetical protein
MATDPAVRQEAESVLGSVFRGLGNRARGEEVGQVGNVDIGGLIGQVEEFVSMPMDLATLFLDMSVDLTKMILNALEEAGFILVKGMTPL